MSKDLREPQQQSEEIDLGQLFKLIGNMFDRFFRFIKGVFYKVFLSFVWLVFFVKKHIIKIIIAGIIGFGYGFFKQEKGEAVYRSTTVIKQNYETGENLYRTVDYYNELISERDSVTLAAVLNIKKPSKAASILRVDVESVITENERIKNYNAYIKSLDSIVASTVTFENYINNSKEFQDKTQRIIIKAEEKDVFVPVINQIVKTITETQYFITEQKKDLDELVALEESIISSLEASKELQQVYKNVLETPNDNTLGSQTSIRIDNTEDKSITKEYELYNDDVVLKRELVKIQREKEDRRNILEVISSQENQGTIDNSKQLFGKIIDSKIYYAIILMMLTSIIMLGLHFVRFLEQYKDKV